jgi:hypothetical protein
VCSGLTSRKAKPCQKAAVPVDNFGTSGIPPGHRSGAAAGRIPPGESSGMAGQQIAKPGAGQKPDHHCRHDKQAIGVEREKQRKPVDTAMGKLHGSSLL